MSKRKRATDPAVMKGAGQCPRCASRKTMKLDASQLRGIELKDIAGFISPILEGCRNCGAIWQPFDPADMIDREDPTSAFREPCDNCAFRPGSAEQQDKELWKSIVASLKEGGTFYCHKGVPIDKDSEHGFDYPKKASKMRICSGYLRMFRVEMEKWKEESNGRLG